MQGARANLLRATLAVMLALGCAPARSVDSSTSSGQARGAVTTNETEGRLVTASIVVGPFDLHRRYESMRGPYLNQQLRVSDLVASGTTVLPEEWVKFVENAPKEEQSMGMGIVTPNKVRPPGLIDTSGRPRELFWLKGIKVEVLDERNQPTPTAEFFCHMSVFVDKDLRNRVAFLHSEPVVNNTLCVLTQGETDFSFPRGFGVPVASDENWRFAFQAANRTTDKHRRIKHRCTLYFIKDRDLTSPIKALNWLDPYICVRVDQKKTATVIKSIPGVPDCSAATSCGVRAPNSFAGSVYEDRLGRKVSGHWTVPPGSHTYRMPLSLEPGLEDFSAEDRMIHAAWCHIHPLCTSTSLVEVTGRRRRMIYTAKAATDCSKGLEIKHIDAVSSQSGIPIKKGHNYELVATYVNRTGRPVDSMIFEGAFFTDTKFVRPGWAAAGASVSKVEH